MQNVKSEKEIIENKIGPNVKFTKDLHCAYKPEEIVNMSVKNPLTSLFQESKVLRLDDKVDTLSVGGFYIQITKDKSIFFFEPFVSHVYNVDKPDYLYFIQGGEFDLGVFIEGSNDFYYETKRPGTMWDLANHIDSNIYWVKSKMEDLRHDFEFKRVRTPQHSFSIHSDDDDDLPF